ncbi:MAG: AraC family transcriptional regulator [Ramlibacter sp.]
MDTTGLSSFADPLGEALHYLRMDGVFYCHSELTAPWGARMPALADCLMFHMVTSGRCWLELDGAGSRWLHPGDFALVSCLPQGRTHNLLHEPGADAPDLFSLPRQMVSERYEVLRHGGGGAPTRLVCGAVRFDHPAARQLVALLPPVIAIEAGEVPHDEGCQTMLRFMADEARTLRPGGEAVITRLADIVVIQAIRHWVQHDPAAQTGWLGALQDRRIGRAISLMHRSPAQVWTVESLAQASAMSRSAFAQRFAALVGQGALQYLTQWRMTLAQAWLAQGSTIADVAARTGYQSESAFSRAFKRSVGVAPGAVARAGRPAL